MNQKLSTSKSPLIFFVLVFALSVPLSLAGTVVKLEVMPGVPISAIAMTFCPLIAALILVYRENKTAGMFELLKRAFVQVTVTSLRFIMAVLLE